MIGRWRARIRSRGDREKGVAGIVARWRRSHCRWREDHWRARLGAYGPRFEEPRTPGEREGAGELDQADTAARGECRDGGRHGRRREHTAARETGSRGHETRNKLHGEREGRTTKLTAQKNRVYGGPRGGRRRIPPTSVRRLLGLPRCLANAKKRAGSSRGARGGFGSL